MKNIIRYLVCITVLLLSVLLICSCSDTNDLPNASENNASNEQSTQINGNSTNISAEKLSAPQNIRYEDGMIMWDAVENATGYVVTVGSTKYEVSECQFVMPNTSSGEQRLMLKTLGDGTYYTESNWTFFTYNNPAGLEKPEVSNYDDNGFKYTLLEDGSGYEVSSGLNNITTWQVEELVIPDTFNGLPVKRIADYGFALSKKENYTTYPVGSPFVPTSCNTATKKIILPALLQSIGDSAFYCTVNIEEIVIPDGVIEIEGSAFYGCTSLKKVIFSKNLKTIGSASFRFCALSELAFPERLETIEAYAFSAYIKREGIESRSEQNFKTVNFPQSIKSIAQYAFQDCEYLENIDLPEGLEYLGIDAFVGTAAYNAQPEGIVCIDGYVVGYKGEMPENTKLVIPSDAKYIATGAFQYQKNLVSIYIPDGVKLKGDYIFESCKSLIEVRLPADLTELPSVFARCDSLKELLLPKSIIYVKEIFYTKCLYYEGNKNELDSIIQKNGYKPGQFTKGEIYYYSETKPTEAGNFWHYVDGKPTVWEE